MRTKQNTSPIRAWGQTTFHGSRKPGELKAEREIRKRKLIELLESNPGCTRATVKQALNIKDSTLSVYLNEMKSQVTTTGKSCDVPGNPPNCKPFFYLVGQLPEILTVSPAAVHDLVRQRPGITAQQIIEAQIGLKTEHGVFSAVKLLGNKIQARADRDGIVSFWVEE